MHMCSMSAEKENIGELTKAVNLFGENFWLATRGNRYRKGNPDEVFSLESAGRRFIESFLFVLC